MINVFILFLNKIRRLIQSDMNNISQWDDATVIRRFAQGESQPVINQNLRIDSAWKTVQLTTLNGELIGILKQSDEHPYALIKYDSKYWDLIHQILLESNFVPVGKSNNQPGFFQYQKHDVPKGYKIRYTEARILWKTWWPRQRRKRKYEIQLDMLVFKQNKWYPIQDIVVNDAIFDIKTLIGEITLSMSDKIVWLEKIEPPQPIEFDDMHTKIQDGGSDPEPSQISVGKPKENVEDRSLGTLERSGPLNNDLIRKLDRKIEMNLDADNKLEKTLLQLKIKAIKAVSSYLENGEIETTTEIVRDAKGEVTSTKTTTTKKSCPEWVIEILLSKGKM
jgi:hypothetical protein